MNNLMAQVQRMQKDIQKKQEEIYKTIYTGESEWVDVEVFGNKEIKKVTIKNKTTMDSEDLECLEDMLKIAISDAHKQIEKDVEKKLGMYGKSLGGLL